MLGTYTVAVDYMVEDDAVETGQNRRYYRSVVQVTADALTGDDDATQAAAQLAMAPRIDLPGLHVMPTRTTITDLVL